MNLTSDIVVPVVAWGVWNVAIAVAVSRLPTQWFARHRPPARAVRNAPAGVGGRSRRRWERWIPDAGAMLPGGSAKRRLAGRDRASLARHAAAARGGELVHWLSLAFAAVCLLWWPIVVVGPIIGVAVLINVPCLIVLRDTQRRIHRLLDLRAQRV